jgi:hypothetical protein
MVGDLVQVLIEKVDVLRHQIDLSVVLPEEDPADGTGGVELVADGEEEQDTL